MNQDSFFQEQFWNIVPMMYQEDYVSDTATIYKLKNKLKSIDLVIQDEQLIKLKDNKATKYLNLIEVTINIDEEGLTFKNKYGILTLNGDALKSLYDLVVTKCMHNNIKSLYEFHSMTHQLANLQIFEITSKQSGATLAAKRYLKSQYNKQQLRQEIHLLDDRIQHISEDDEYVYVVIHSLNGSILENLDLNFEDCQFGILKLLQQYHIKNTIVGNLSFSNIILLDKYLNMEILDTTSLKPAAFSFSPNGPSLKDDVYALGLLLQKRYPLQVEHYSKYLLPIAQRPSVQEILFEGSLVNHFGDRVFYQMLNSKIGEVVPQYHTSSQLESFVLNQMNQIDTFNTIRGCMMDSSDESNDDEIKNPYQDWMNQFRQAKYRTQSFEEDSPMLTPKITQNQTKHKSKLSSRQMVLEKLLNENIISQKQFQQFYKEEDFENQDELNEFGMLLQKEIANSSSITTPIQSQNTTCPNTVKINCGNKEALSRVSVLMEELQLELKQTQLDQPYNVNKVQNVRKNLCNFH